MSVKQGRWQLHPGMDLCFQSVWAHCEWHLPQDQSPQLGSAEWLAAKTDPPAAALTGDAPSVSSGKCAHIGRHVSCTHEILLNVNALRGCHLHTARTCQFNNTFHMIYLYSNMPLMRMQCALWDILPVVLHFFSYMVHTSSILLWNFNLYWFIQLLC